MARALTPHKWNEGTTAALYVANRQPISDMFNSLLVKTADTGQVNWATVTTVPGANVIRDYEVFRLNDALQATAPIFIRVDYVSWPIGASNTDRYPKLQFTVGTATDGAGNLRGATTPPMECNSYANTNIGSWNAYASTGASGAQLVFFWGLTPPHLLPRSQPLDSWSGVVIERFRNADGTANAEGYTAWFFDSTSAGQTGLLRGQYSRVFAGGQSDALCLMTMMPVAGASYFGDNNAYAAAVHHFGPALRGPSQAWLIGFNNDFPRATEVTLPHSGRQLKFMAIGSAGTMQLPYASSVTQTAMKYDFAPLLRWE